MATASPSPSSSSSSSEAAHQPSPRRSSRLQQLQESQAARDAKLRAAEERAVFIRMQQETVRAGIARATDARRHGKGSLRSVFHELGVLGGLQDPPNQFFAEVSLASLLLSWYTQTVETHLPVKDEQGYLVWKQAHGPQHFQVAVPSALADGIYLLVQILFALGSSSLQDAAATLEQVRTHALHTKC